MKLEKRSLTQAILFTIWGFLLALGIDRNIVWLIWSMLGILIVACVYMVIEGMEMLT
jgi:hypothetical protein